MRRLAAAAFGGAGHDGGFHFGCPECGHAITVDSTSAGSRIACPECEARIEVPTLAASNRGAGGEGATRAAILPRPREGDSEGISEGDLEERETRQAHDDQHRLNPDRKLKFIPFEGTVAPGYDEPGARVGFAGPARGPGWLKITGSILGVLALGAGIFFFLDWSKGGPGKPGSDSGPASALSPEVVKLEASYAKFREALSPESRAPFVRHPQITLPRMNAYYQLRGIDPPTPMLLPHTAKAVTEGGVEFIRCEAQFKSRMVYAFFEKNEDGDYLVDWESLVGFSPDEWGLYVASAPSDPQEFCVFIGADEYFGEEFQDRAKSSCARLYHLDGSNDLYGYVARGSEIDGEMSKLVALAKQDRERPVPCRARIRFVRPGKNARQVEILSLSPGWLVPVEAEPEPEPAVVDPGDVPGVDPVEPTEPEGAVEPEAVTEPEPGGEEIPRALPPVPAVEEKTEVIPSAIPLER